VYNNINNNKNVWKTLSESSFFLNPVPHTLTPGPFMKKATHYMIVQWRNGQEKEIAWCGFFLLKSNRWGNVIFSWTFFSSVLQAPNIHRWSSRLVLQNRPLHTSTM